MTSVAAGYLPILLFLAIALILSSAFVFLPMIAARFTGTHNPTPEKLTEYECGFPAFEGSRAQFDVRFDSVAGDRLEIRTSNPPGRNTEYDIPWFEKLEIRSAP